MQKPSTRRDRRRPQDSSDLLKRRAVRQSQAPSGRGTSNPQTPTSLVKEAERVEKSRESKAFLSESSSESHQDSPRSLAQNYILVGQDFQSYWNRRPQRQRSFEEPFPGQVSFGRGPWRVL